MNEQSKFHFPTTANFTHSSLVEAWLTIRWKLEPVSTNPEFQRDDLFPIALGRFDHAVKEKYGFRTELEVNRVPAEMTPHIVRFQFRNGGPEEWPLLQIGPGIATVNFHSPCSWTDFKKEALFLRESVVNSYSERVLTLDSLILTYRNGLPFDYSNENLKEFLEEKLHIGIQFSQYIPGAIAENDNLKDLNMTSSFNLIEPASATGIMRIATGTKKLKSENVEHVFFDIEVGGKKNLPDMNSEESFSTWIEQAHSVCHEWFMATIEGNLFNEFTKEREVEDASSAN